MARRAPATLSLLALAGAACTTTVASAPSSTSTSPTISTIPTTSIPPPSVTASTTTSTTSIPSTTSTSIPSTTSTSTTSTSTTSTTSTSTTTTTVADVPPPSAVALVDWDRFDAALAASLVGGSSGAAAVAVGGGGSLTHAAAFGARAPGTSEAVTPAHRFRIASISKVLTAVVTLQLVEEGRVGLDEPVGDRLAWQVGEAPADPDMRAVTPARLLSHTSGIAKFRGVYFSSPTASCHDAARIAMAGDVASPAGYVYSNTNYCLLGLLIEQLTGMPYEQAVRERLLDPLGISGMRLAGTHDAGPDEVVHPSREGRTYMEALGAAGAWLATAGDVVRIVMSLDPANPGWHPLGDELLRAMRTPQSLAPGEEAQYGFGIMVWPDGSWGHTGTVENTRALVQTRPDGVVIAAFTNRESPSRSSDLRDRVDRALAAASPRPLLRSVCPTPSRRSPEADRSGRPPPTLPDVIPVLTPAEMRAVDAAAPEPVETLIERAGSAVARVAVEMLGGTYGRVVDVVAGPGNNGADGRVAARRLEERGARVRVFDAAACPDPLPPADLVIDAAFGTGFHGWWRTPDPGDAPILAVDIPSGVDGLTGLTAGTVRPAAVTVTFAAAKPGLYLGEGPSLVGDVRLVDIGLDVSRASTHVVQRADVAAWLRPRAFDAHKWGRAVRVVAGSPGMPGAAHLVAAAAQRAGAGMVHLSSPGTEGNPPIEAVSRRIPAFDWADQVLSDLHRFHALAIGPGLGREDHTAPSVTKVVMDAVVPVVIDGDGLFALTWNEHGAPTMLRARQVATVLTPHDGEYALLTGAPPGADRLLAARRLAADTSATVLLKGPTTVLAAPDGQALLVTNGDQRLATAGSGDVLSGIVAAFLAEGGDALRAAAAAAWVHAEAAMRGPARGLVASDLLPLLPAVLEDVW
jgi:ADP-dependent NAD(P)H-hydrate dehydratase / NAD(P)H-hydrate epimerase